MWIVLFLSKDYEANSSSDYLLRENTIVQTNRLQQCFLMGEKKGKKKCVCVVCWGWGGGTLQHSTGTKAKHL